MTTWARESESHLKSLVRTIDENTSVTITGERRNAPRRPLRFECDLCLSYGPDLRFCTVEGIVRNVTFDGVSVVAELTKPIRAGRPVEVRVPSLGGPQAYMAGIVVFCRQVDGECCEVGIYVKASSSDPILTRDAERARDEYAWFAEALNVREDS